MESCKLCNFDFDPKGDVTPDDSQRPIFSATQRYNIVATLFRMVTRLFQHCNVVLLKKSSLRIVQASEPCYNFNISNVGC